MFTTQVNQQAPLDKELLEKAKQIAPFHVYNDQVVLYGDNASIHNDIDELMIETLEKLGLVEFAKYVREASKDFWYE